MPNSAIAIVIGHLGRDPVMKFTGQGTAVCDFSIATSVKRGDVQFTTWWKVKAWAKLAELCNSNLVKGAAVQVVGRVSTEEYTDKDGVLQKVLTIDANEVTFLSERTAAPADHPRAQAAAATPRPGQYSALDVVMGASLNDDSDDIPF